MTLIDRAAFRAAALDDPEIHAQFLIERRREACRDAERLREARRLEGVGDVAPEVLEPASEAALLARAERAVAERKAFRLSAEGRFLTALEAMETTLSRATGLLDQARAARARNFQGERALCRRAAAGLCDLAKALRAGALDAVLAADLQGPD